MFYTNARHKWFHGQQFCQDAFTEQREYLAYGEIHNMYSEGRGKFTISIYTVSLFNKLISMQGGGFPPLSV